MISATADAATPSAKLSMGIAAAASPFDLEQLLQPADSAFHAAKRAGRDRTVVHRAPVLQHA